MPCTCILLILKVDWSYDIKIVVIKNLSPFKLYNSPPKHLKFWLVCLYFIKPLKLWRICRKLVVTFFGTFLYLIISLLQICQILHNVCKKEGLTLPAELSKRIAEKSNRNLRRALLMCEACRVQQYVLAKTQISLLGRAVHLSTCIL